MAHMEYKKGGPGIQAFPIDRLHFGPQQEGWGRNSRPRCLTFNLLPVYVLALMPRRQLQGRPPRL